ncbi:Mrp/NBP35 family ATP-binding protein [Pararhodospirillum photometricum]|uniref:Iron-sulfur cluster carrier protein n=1 Tax=Pararhodospirillum photometricum DSM 122 TaxID=1150469 RepID=H6SIH8_PARPM|nr:Mrp/NBP35 family ATP-binding protein [Pararhodospirillum photometricum]CCG06744.1 Putative uncharacterized protein [Pararhodospirillum photometricum DSM 122]
MLSRDALLDALARVAPASAPGQNVVSLGWVEGLAWRAENGQMTVNVSLGVPPDLGPSLEPLCREAEAALAAVPGVDRARVVLTAQRPPAAPAPTTPRGPIALPGIRRIVGVASGKGGVGKSTTAVNLAIALRDLGLSVAMLDADIYGPSLPRLLGVAGTRPASGSGRLKPVVAHDLSVMSIGFLVPEEDPVVWRGPMVAGALEQLLRDVDWGEHDVLVIDMPPGTGDAHLTLCQKVALDGVAIVSTPQDIALLDARKGLAMFQKMGVRVLGFIENMSYYLCPACGHRDDIFSTGGARRAAADLGTPFLGALPLDIQVREGADAGIPVGVSAPTGPHAHAYAEIARQIWAALNGEDGARAD